MSVPERSRLPAPEGSSDARASDDRSPPHGKFLLEPLEPRVLLSAEPLLGEIYRSLLQDESERQAAELAVIVEEIDAATSAEIAAADAEDFGSAASSSNVQIAWPEGWQGSAENDSQVTSADDPDQGVPDAGNAAEATPELTLLAGPTTAQTTTENSAPADDSSLAATAENDQFTSFVAGSGLARAPPADDAISAALVAAAALHDNDLGLSDSSAVEEGGP